MAPSIKHLDAKTDGELYDDKEDHDPVSTTAPRANSEGVEDKGPDIRGITLPVEYPQVNANVVATEDYSVFTVKQKRMMIATASFASWIR